MFDRRGRPVGAVARRGSSPSSPAKRCPVEPSRRRVAGLLAGRRGYGGASRSRADDLRRRRTRRPGMRDQMPESRGRARGDRAADPGPISEFAAGRAALADGLRAVVFIDLPGGNAVASIKLLAAFRKLRLSAIVAGFASNGNISGPVAGQCVSACVYALMGAVLYIPGLSRIALHRMSIEPEGRRRASFRRRPSGRHRGALCAQHGGQSGAGLGRRN